MWLEEKKSLNKRSKKKNCQREIDIASKEFFLLNLLVFCQIQRLDILPANNSFFSKNCPPSPLYIWKLFKKLVEYALLDKLVNQAIIRCQHNTIVTQQHNTTQCNTIVTQQQNNATQLWQLWSKGSPLERLLQQRNEWPLLMPTIQTMKLTIKVKKRSCYNCHSVTKHRVWVYKRNMRNEKLRQKILPTRLQVSQLGTEMISRWTGFRFWWWKLIYLIWSLVSDIRVKTWLPFCESPPLVCLNDTSLLSIGLIWSFVTKCFQQVVLKSDKFHLKFYLTWRTCSEFPSQH